MTPDICYDVFLSFTGTDRADGRVLATTLRKLGLRVFSDEDSIGYFEGITESITQALGSSKLLVAYYSKDYARRPACQLELMTAFLAGQRQGNPCARIAVINPEHSYDHLLPVELADARYAPIPASNT